MFVVNKTINQMNIITVNEKTEACHQSEDSDIMIDFDALFMGKRITVIADGLSKLSYFSVDSGDYFAPSSQDYSQEVEMIDYSIFDADGEELEELYTSEMWDTVYEILNSYCA